MSEYFERHPWRRRAVGATTVLALGGCATGPSASQLWTNPTAAGYEQLSDGAGNHDLNCFTGPRELSGTFDYGDVALHAIIVRVADKTGALTDGMSVKFLGKDSSVIATREKGTGTGATYPPMAQSEVTVIKDVLPGVTVTATVVHKDPFSFNVDAQCS